MLVKTIRYGKHASNIHLSCVLSALHTYMVVGRGEEGVWGRGGGGNDRERDWGKKYYSELGVLCAAID
jgi:hypothetical protein